MKTRKLYEDVVGVIIAPFIGVAYILLALGFFALFFPRKPRIKQSSLEDY